MTAAVRATACCAALVAAACTGGDDSERPTPERRSTDERSGVIGTEFKGETGPSTTLWAQLYSTRADKPFKSIWRMTGGGRFSITATGPRGRTVKPDGGPQPHGSSNWDRPGDEWGVYWTIPRPGVWTFRASRADGSSGTVEVRFR